MERNSISDCLSSIDFAIVENCEIVKYRKFGRYPKSFIKISTDWVYRK